ncbi:DUF2089 domain-containing protein [candidate division WOR-3 bacterium]|uniref:DUF2089 domain-containing protein n=1 Tax=candidate division WOR-3 bacterium TaxID=2052148 RepID=A0A937XHB3_UNCW3|nr:DUF2089 domain-containing protein [candidate division WOR-3 bacterium]
MVSRCPVCESGMAVSELTCEACGTSVRGRFQVPDLCRLPDELYQFLLVFVKNRGVIRDVEKELGISYPTVRSRLDAVLAALGFGEQVGRSGSNEVIEMLERGEITPEEAEKMLRGESDSKQE